MKYPKFIEENSTLGITAISNGIVDNMKRKRLDYAIEKFQQIGFKVIETEDVRTDFFGKSAPSNIQAKELEDLYKNKDVSAVFCAAGGDFLIEALPFINFDIIKSNPKWIQGYSDPTALLFTITTNLDIATLYGNNVCSFAMKEWHKSLVDNFKILSGEKIIQKSFNKYEKISSKYIIGNEGYNLDSMVYWDVILGKEINISGRIIGGCIDTISDLFGTKYDKVIDFVEKYKDDGIIWYFDNAELTSEALIRTLWKFRENGWFKYTKCILFSRIIEEKSFYGISYNEAIKQALKDLDVSVAINCDFGHVAPRMTIINGSIAKIKILNGKGEISFILN